MKSIVAVLSESPLYFTMALRDRHRLVKRLASKVHGPEQEIDLTGYTLKVNKYLYVDGPNPAGEFCRYSPFNQEID